MKIKHLLYVKRSIFMTPQIITNERRTPPDTGVEINL